MRSVRLAALLFLIGGLLSVRLLPRVLQEYGAVPQAANTSDDAAALIARYGRPDHDTTSRATPDAAATRVLSYGELQIVFIEKEFPSARAWKMLGFLDAKSRMSLTGDEALARLLAYRAENGAR